MTEATPGVLDTVSPSATHPSNATPLVAVTVRHPVHVEVPPSGLTTTTSRGPGVALGAAPAVAVSCVAELRVTFWKVTPVPEAETVGVATYPVPVIVTGRREPRVIVFGVTEVVVGAALTVNPPVDVAELPFGLVTVTLRAPVAAPWAMSMTTVSWVADWRVTESTVIPDPENETVGALSNPVPAMTIERFCAP
jgi:hypothetical protein